MFDDHDDSDWREGTFALMRVIAGVIIEYGPMVGDPNSPAGWTLADLRDLNHELLTALELGSESAVEALSQEARLLIKEVLRLIR